MNGEERQNSTTDDLIFSVPFLIKTLSEGQTIRPGDVIATGTPAGVGFGQKPPVWLKEADVVEVSVTGLGVLKNSIAAPSSVNATVERVGAEKHIVTNNLDKTCGGVNLTFLNSKQLYYRQAGPQSGPPIIFIHGLGGSSEFFGPLITSLGLDQTHSLHLLDLEGHGLSPTVATSVVSIASYAQDVFALAEYARISGATVIAHSMGSLVALDFAAKHPEVASKLVLLGPPPSPIPEAGRSGSNVRAATVRASGMAAVVDSIITAATSSKSKTANPLAIAATRLSLLCQDPEGYAKGCTALAGVVEPLPVSQIRASVLIVTGEEDKVSPPAVCEKYAAEISGAKVQVLSQVGHWHIFEDVKGVAGAVGHFI